MRLVRFPARPARVSDDVRASLAALGRGGEVVGGVGLLGVRPPGLEADLDALLVLPHGIVVVVGVDLPAPALTLRAPLHGAWEADGWPLAPDGPAGKARTGDTPPEDPRDRPDAPAAHPAADPAIDPATAPTTDPVTNPATGALALAGAVADRVHALDPGVGVVTIVAVGPYAETVEQPPEDRAGPVRVVYPSASALWTALNAVPPSRTPLSVDRATTLLRGLAPSVTVPDPETLAAEGFTPPEEPAARPAGPAGQQDRPHLAERAHEEAGVSRTGTDGTGDPSGGTTSEPRRSPARRVVLAAGALALVAAVTVWVAATVGRDGEAPAAGPESSPGGLARPSAGIPVDGLRFHTVATERRDDCRDPRAVGDLRSFLREHGCTRLHRGSYETVVGERGVAVSVATVTLRDDAVAADFHELATAPGSGMLVDIGTQTGRWRGAGPEFAHATFDTARQDRTVRLVLTDALDGAADADDPAQVRAAQAALSAPLG